MIIGTCGFGSTGSSAVSDYLMEFNENMVLDQVEFVFPYAPDGLVDLEYHIMEKNSRQSSSIYALERYKRMMLKRYARQMVKHTRINKEQLRKTTEEFIDSLIQVSWLSYKSVDSGLWKRIFGFSIMKQRIIPFVENRFGYSINVYPKEMVGISIKPSNFYESAKKHMCEILEFMGADFSKNIVLDQPFSGNNPQASFPFFDDPYAIVVDRDPRDIYLFGIKKLMSVGYFMPVDNVENFVTYYRLMRDNQPYKDNNDRILRVRFEDMVYNYENATEKIRLFCGLPENPKPKSIFDPSLSIANTQLYKRYSEYESDIKYIEKELSEYLFCFENYSPITEFGEMFYGKSPLNK